MGTNGNQWGANGKAVEKFKKYVLGKFECYFSPFVINERSMEYHWNKKYHSTNGKMNGISYDNTNGNIYLW